MSTWVGGREVRVLGAWTFSVHFFCLLVKQENVSVEMRGRELVVVCYVGRRQEILIWETSSEPLQGWGDQGAWRSARGEWS